MVETLVSDVGCNFVMGCASNRPPWLFRDSLSVDLDVGEFRCATGNIGGTPVYAVSFCSPSGQQGLIRNFISDCHGSRARDGAPSMTLDYNRNSGKVDNLNQLVLGNMVRYKSSSWESALFNWILGVCAQNARVVFNRLHGSTLTLAAFQRTLARELSSDSAGNQHRLIQMGLRRHCSWCRRLGTSSSTSLCCTGCHLHPPLHAACFKLWHSSIGL